MHRCEAWQLQSVTIFMRGRLTGSRMELSVLRVSKLHLDNQTLPCIGDITLFEIAARFMGAR